MKVKIVNRSNCRLCSSKDLTKILNFNSIPFFDEIVTKENLGKDFSYPMNLYFCNKCLSVQSKHDINIKEYYKNYQYVASNSSFIKSYMQSLVDFCFKRFIIVFVAYYTSDYFCWSTAFYFIFKI